VPKLSGLQSLRLRGTKISGVGLIDQLGSLPELKRVDLRQTMISDDSVQNWKSLQEGRRALH
jgi:hypothetical protein